MAGKRSAGQRAGEAAVNFTRMAADEQDDFFLNEREMTKDANDVNLILNYCGCELKRILG